MSQSVGRVLAVGAPHFTDLKASEAVAAVADGDTGAARCSRPTH